MSRSKISKKGEAIKITYLINYTGNLLDKL